MNVNFHFTRYNKRNSSSLRLLTVIDMTTMLFLVRAIKKTNQYLQWTEFLNVKLRCNAINTVILWVTFHGNSFNDSEVVTRWETNENDLDKSPVGRRNRLDTHVKIFGSFRREIHANNIQIFRPCITVNAVTQPNIDQLGNTLCEIPTACSKHHQTHK